MPLGPGLTVVAGPNGAGKTNLLEVAYLACTGRSFRHVPDRELVRRDADAGHVTAEVRAGEGRTHRFGVGVSIGPEERRRTSIDGQPVERLLDHPARPRLSVFLPDRMVLVKGGPALRRAHLDQLLVALRPGAADVRGRYLEALRQRNALLGQLRDTGALPGPGGVARAASRLDPWDRSLAVAAAELTAARAAAVDQIAGSVAARAEKLGLEGSLALDYRARASVDPDEVLATLRDRHAGDVERGFTHQGPHRDELAVRRDGRLLARYGSQGEQRLGLLAIVLGETDAVEEATGRRPIVLLDDVMSELDRRRRERLVDAVRGRGQVLVTVTEADHVPGADDGRIGRIDVAPGRAEVLRVAQGG